MSEETRTPDDSAASAKRGRCTLYLADVALLPSISPRVFKTKPWGTTFFDEKRVRDYERLMKSGVEFPPILVGAVKLSAAIETAANADDVAELREARRDGNEVLVLIDGVHRCMAWRGGEIEAEIIEVRDLQHARWLAVQANLGHGLNLKASEKRTRLDRYVEAGEYYDRDAGGFKSWRQIGRELGMSHEGARKAFKQRHVRVFNDLSRRLGEEDEPSHKELTVEELREARQRGALDALVRGTETLIDAAKANVARIKTEALLGDVELDGLATAAEALLEAIQEAGGSAITLNDDLSAYAAPVRPQRQT